MQAITRCSLATHEGDYASWPGKSPLIVDGRELPIHIPGYTLLHQYETTSGYVLVTDYDCPFEECTVFILLDKAFNIVDRRFVGAAYCSYALEHISWSGEGQFIARFYGMQERWQFTIRTGRVWWPWHRLAMKVIPAPLTELP